MFYIDMTPAVITLLSALVAALLYAVLVLRVRVMAISRAAQAAAPDAQVPLPSVSVIVYTQDGDENLPALLDSVLTQDYPAEMEVIVVNDGAPGEVQDIVGRLQQEYGNLYLTFVPDMSRNLSRKKMAITLGIKAAKNEVMALTTGNCVVPSPRWLASMCAPLAAGGKEVAIGYARPSGVGQNLCFDYLFTAVTYLAAAARGRAYRGTECNLAYRRSVFFRNKGFSSHLNFNYGDDDIFVSEVARRGNVQVVLNPEAQLSIRSRQPMHSHRIWRLRYDFTLRHIATHAPGWMRSTVVAWWVALGCAVGLALAGLPSLLPLCVAGGLAVITYVSLVLTWKPAIRALGSMAGTWLAPLLMLWRPFYNLRYRLRGRKDRNINYTWTHQRL